MASVADCCERCQMGADCVAFAFYTSGLCFLKHEMGQLMPNPLMTAGIMLRNGTHNKGRHTSGVPASFPTPPPPPFSSSLCFLSARCESDFPPSLGGRKFGKGRLGCCSAAGGRGCPASQGRGGGWVGGCGPTIRRGCCGGLSSVEKTLQSAVLGPWVEAVAGNGDGDAGWEVRAQQGVLDSLRNFPRNFLARRSLMVGF